MSTTIEKNQIAVNRMCAVLSAHESVSEIFGVPVESLTGKNLMSYIPEHAHDSFQTEWANIVAGISRSVYANVMHLSGYVVPLEVVARIVSEDVLHLSLLDLSHRTALQDELNAVRENYMLLSETTTDGILQINNDLQIIFANNAAEKMLDFEHGSLVEKNLSLLFPSPQYKRYKKLIMRYFVIDDQDRHSTGMQNVMEALAQKKGGDMVAVELSMGNSKGVGDSRLLTCIIRDITLRKKADRRLRYLAYHDKLTSLGNRDRFSETLNRTLKGMRDKPNHHAALLYLDLDGFKKINDSLGHEMGDAILKACAKRLGNCLREGDEVYRFDFEEIFRLGGDEFTILLPYINKPEDAAIVAGRVIDKLTQPYNIEGWEAIKNIRLGVSIGIAIIPRDGRDRTTLLRNADAAMYRAKEKGNNFEFFTEEMNNMAMERLLMEEGIRQALSENEFELYYQPIVDADKNIVSAEALIRWNHPKRGVLPPKKFISLAEETDLIKPLGTWVLSTACTQLKELHEAGWPDIPISINLAPAQLDQRDIADTVGRIVARSGLEPRHLHIEITETTVMQNPELSRQKIDLIKGMNDGVKISIDDFGIGYSSLAYLTRYSVDYLKIDRSFVMGIEKNENAKVIKTIIDLATSLGLEVVAEGVETEEQFSQLLENECHYFQGYLFSKPQPLEKIRELVKGKSVGRMIV
ncbi:MAG: GGDEF domain-containing protein [Spirochaetales bacterium]|nr:GGDEF domain-containing protein [Spirochaetales bacterium]